MPRQKVLEQQAKTTVVLDAPQLARIERFATARGQTRSYVIRQAIDLFLAVNDPEGRTAEPTPQGTAA